MFRCALMLLMLLVPAAAQADYFGKFEGKLQLTEVDDDDPECKSSHWVGQSAFRLLAPYSYVDKKGKSWKVPKGTCVNGASIPIPAQGIVGGPWAGKFKNASVIHDYHCTAMLEPWQDVHHMFFEAMLAKGVSRVKAGLMYYAVYAFGPRWQTVVHNRVATRSISGCPSGPGGRCRAFVTNTIKTRTVFTPQADQQNEQQMQQELARVEELLKQGKLDVDQIPKFADHTSKVKFSATKVVPRTETTTTYEQVK